MTSYSPDGNHSMLPPWQGGSIAYGTNLVATSENCQPVTTLQYSSIDNSLRQQQSDKIYPVSQVLPPYANSSLASSPTSYFAPLHRSSSFFPSTSYSPFFLPAPIPISPAWLERPPAPGEPDWTPFGPTAPSNSKAKNGKKRCHSATNQDDDDDGDDAETQSDDSAEGNARQAANIRERKRMRQLNEAFVRLRGHIPQDLFVENKKSKLTVLRAAIRYMKMLSDTLISRGGDGKAAVGPISSGAHGAPISRARQLQLPQSIVVTSPLNQNFRVRISWRIADIALASFIGRLSPRPPDDENQQQQQQQVMVLQRSNSSTISDHDDQLAQDAKMRCVTWIPEIC